jgi:hypothetical protein
MRHRVFGLVAIAVLAAGCVYERPVVVHDRPPPPPAPVVREIVTVTPPPVQVVEVEPAARVGYVWVRGYWHWNGREYVAVRGHWETVRVGWHYVHAHWEQRGPEFVFRAGGWVRD